MRIFSFDASVGHPITRFDSRGAVMIGIQRGDGMYQLGCLRLGPGGVLGHHQATTHQLLLVVEGSGRVRAGDEPRRPIAAGQAVYWEPGEWHETTTEAGLTAFILEADALNPGQFLSEVEG